MKVDIWSDVRCPFCYIGKRKFEKALEKFPHKDKVEVTWRSFQLDPNLKTDESLNLYDYFAELKGISREQGKQMNDRVKEIGKEVGLTFNFDNSVVANSFNAHRLIQLAKAKGAGAEAEEQLFRVHFTENKNIDDKTVLLQVGRAIGLDEKELNTVLSSDAYSGEVRQDEQQARSIGVRGVPFFLFQDKYAVSGAQQPETFLQILNRTWEEIHSGEIDNKQEANRSL